MGGPEPAVGHEQSGRRPVLIFCNEVIATPIGLVTVLPLTTWKTGRRVYPTEVLLPRERQVSPSASLVLAHQVRTISARRLSAGLGAPSDPTLRDRVSRALRLWLDLDGVRRVGAARSTCEMRAGPVVVTGSGSRPERRPERPNRSSRAVKPTARRGAATPSAGEQLRDRLEVLGIGVKPTPWRWISATTASLNGVGTPTSPPCRRRSR